MKKIHFIVYIPLFLILSFLCTVSFVQAANHSCVKGDVCTTIPETEAAIAQCDSSGGTFHQETCSVHACVVNNICTDLSMLGDFAIVAKCAQQNGEFFTKTCGALKKYGCQIGAQCTNIFTDGYDSARCSGELLRGLCPTFTGDCSVSDACKAYSCVVVKDPENKLKPGDCRDFKSASDADAIAEARKICASTITEADKVKIYTMPCAGTERDQTINRGETAAQLLQKAASTLNPASISTPTQLIRKAINALMAFIGSITLLLYVLAGFLWMTASGNAERVDRAKRILVWTTLGIFVMLFSYMLVNFLFNSIPKL